MRYILSFLYIALTIYTPVMFYHFIQYTKKKDSNSVRGYIVESHYREGLKAGIIALLILFGIGIASTFT